jgi:glucosamine--fructose-6-phosphate aminotransferase (isomerizing)
MAMIDRGFPVIAIVPNGPGSRALQPVLERLRDLAADTLIVGNGPALDLATVRLDLPDLGPELLSPIPAIVPMQLLALHLARQRGIDPDEPRGLKKVTETR